MHPADLNALRLGPDASLSGLFTVTLASSSGEIVCPPTPSDVEGPFHLPPEHVPHDFPERSTACVPDPTCGPTCGDAASHGLPLVLQVEVRSSKDCARLEGSATAIDVWQADAGGRYWDDDGHWERRRLQRHAYNCRAHMSGGVAAFDTMLPGHYVAGAAWRPRHIHMRVRAPAHETLVTQVYFHGDPLLGDADTACPVCKSDHPDLIVPLSLSSASGEVGWSLAALGNDSVFSVVLPSRPPTSPSLPSRPPTSPLPSSSLSPPLPPAAKASPPAAFALSTTTSTSPVLVGLLIGLLGLLAACIAVALNCRRRGARKHVPRSPALPQGAVLQISSVTPDMDGVIDSKERL
jgi:hypothetical protein